MARHGDSGKPLYLSELSWPSSRGQIPVRYGYETGERGQARRLTSALRLLAANRRRLGLRRVYWYTWLTRETSPNYPFDYAGLRRLHETRVRSKPALHLPSHGAGPRGLPCKAADRDPLWLRLPSISA
jgi:hypothetical protein